MTGDSAYLLAIDTSTETAGLALYREEQVSELLWRAGRNQTATVLEQIDRLLTMNGVCLDQVESVAVAIGPGSFNGLRVGLSVAKGLCYGLGRPIVGIETLDALAYPHVGTRAAIRAFVAAGRGRVVYADYKHRNNRWVRLSDLRNERLEDLANGLTERTVLVGDLGPGERAQLGSKPLVVIPSPALSLRRPGYLGEIGYRRWRAGETDDLSSLEPVYVHGPASGAVESQ